MSSATSSADDVPKGIIPKVAPEGGSNKTVWIFGGLLLIGAALLFVALNDRRAAISAPATKVATNTAGGRISSPPDLTLPPQPRIYPRMLRRLPADRRANTVPVPIRRAATVQAPAPIVRRAAAPSQEPIYQEPIAEPKGPAIYDARSALTGPVSNQPAASPPDPDRVQATRFLNPATTVPKGTIIPAVLETALDSTRSGAVRAIVSRHVRSFDGSRILIPRGSRLYGEYGAEVAPGQNRALIRWTRLIRPDGVTIALDSPAADPLGRAGVRGKVNSHFLKRFGGAILQSVLDIGVGVATRKAGGDQVVVALPGSTQSITSQNNQQIVPTLTVKHGTSVSVFAAKDLDFTSVEY